jgi:uncharacterized protein YkwD
MSLIGKRVIVLGACLALIFSLVQGLGAKWLPGPQSVRVSYLFELERAIYHLTNEVRQRNGVPPLTWESSLRDVARAHSADMLVRNYFSHNSPKGSTPDERIRAGCRLNMTWTGENIWMGTGYQPGDTTRLARLIVDNWMSSPGHRSNLLRPEFTDIGVGVAASGNNIKVTQVFIRHQQKR